MITDVLHIDSETIDASVSMARRVAEHLPRIEGYISQGVPYRVIVASLNSIGIHLDLATFNSTLYRLRKKVKKESSTVIKQGDSQAKTAEENVPKQVLPTHEKKVFKFDVHEPVKF